MTITEFLNARLDEDERDARAIKGAKYFEGVESDAEAETMRLSDPDRVLAEVAAKRRIVEMHGQAVAIDAVLDLLASVHSDHPDYDAAWRPA
jgi:hypothetical protein